MAKVLRVGVAVLLFPLVLALSPYTVDAAGPIKTLVYAWGVTILFIVWAVGTAIRRVPVRRPPLFFPVVVAFLLWYAVAAALSAYPGHSLQTLREFVFLFVLYFVAAQVYRTPQHIQHLLAAWVCAMGLASVYGFLQWFGWDPFPWADVESADYRQLPASFANPNYAAHALILAIVAVAYLGSRRGTHWWALTLLLFVPHLIMTRQRAGWLALATAVAAVVLLYAVAHKKRRLAAAVVIAAVILGVAGLALLPVDQSILLRVNGYLSAAQMIAENPVFGYGPGNYVIANPAFWTPYESWWFADELLLNSHVHNELLEIAIDAGLPALFLFLCLVAGVLVRGAALASVPEDEARRSVGYFYVALFAAFLVDALFGFNLRLAVSAVFFFLMMGSLAGMHATTELLPAERASRLAPVLLRGAAVAVVLAAAAMEWRRYVAETLLFEGKGNVGNGAYSAAVGPLERGKNLAPWNWRFAQLLGAAHFGQGQYEPAVDDLETSLDANPNWIPTLIPLVRSKLGLAGNAITAGDVETARDHLAQAERSARRLTSLCEACGDGPALLGRVELTRAALANRQDDADARQRYAEAALGHLQEARRITYRNPSELELMRAQALLWSGALDEAAQTLQSATRSAPNDMALWGAFEELSSETGDYGAYRGALLDAIERLEGSRARNWEVFASLYVRLARIEARRENNAVAGAALRKAVDVAPLNLNVWAAFAEFAAASLETDAFRNAVLQTVSDHEGSLDEIPLALRALNVFYKDPSQGLTRGAELLLNATRDEDRQTEVHETLPWLTRILFVEFQRTRQIFRQQPRGVLDIGVLLTAIQEYESAAALFGGAYPHLEGEAQLVCAQYWSGALLRDGQFIQSAGVAQLGLRTAPDDARLRLTLGRALAAAGNSKEARDVLTGLLRDPSLDDPVREAVRAELQRLGNAE